MAKKQTALVGAVVGVLALAFPARAADTTTTFSLAAGSLAISAPASRDLGSGPTGGGTVSAQLGTVTVTDDRGALAGAWTASVSSTDFTTGGATANETIGKAQITYWSGAATSSSGTRRVHTRAGPRRERAGAEHPGRSPRRPSSGTTRLRGTRPSS